MEKPVSLRILFAEDDDSLRLSMTQILTENAGYQVEACARGEEAIEHLKYQQFNVVILDHKMPGLSGLNVIQWMHEQKMETPVIMFTGAGTEVVAVEAMKLGAYDYIRKEHVDIDHLPIVINGVYERYLFKKEREHRTVMEQRNLALMAAFQDTVESVAHVLDNVLSAMSMNLESYQRELDRLAGSPSHDRLVEAFARIKQDHSVIAFAISSILNSTSSLYEKFKKETELVKQEAGKV